MGNTDISETNKGIFNWTSCHNYFKVFFLLMVHHSSKGISSGYQTLCDSIIFADIFIILATWKDDPTFVWSPVEFVTEIPEK